MSGQHKNRYAGTSVPPHTAVYQYYCRPTTKTTTISSLTADL